MRLVDYLDKGASLGADAPCLTMDGKDLSYGEVQRLSYRIRAVSPISALPQVRAPPDPDRAGSVIGVATRRGGSGQRRLAVIVALVASMTITLVGRLVYVQVLDPHKPVQTAGLLHQASYVVPAPRGEIVDSRGRLPSATPPCLSVDGDTLAALPDRGAAVLGRLAGLLKTSAATLAREITPCSSKVGAPCWTGEPYQPVPVASVPRPRWSSPSASTVRTIPASPADSHRAELPRRIAGGARPRLHRRCRCGRRAGRPSLTNADTIGRTGLRRSTTRCCAARTVSRYVELDPRDGGRRPGRSRRSRATLWSPASTRTCRRCRAVAREADRGLARRRAAGDVRVRSWSWIRRPGGSSRRRATRPMTRKQFVGGISNSAYAALTSRSANDPLLSRRRRQYAPGSTFKLITAVVRRRASRGSLTGTYPCPPYLPVDGRVKTNYDSESFGGPLTLARSAGLLVRHVLLRARRRRVLRGSGPDRRRSEAGRIPAEMAAAVRRRSHARRRPAGRASRRTGSYADRETRLARWSANKHPVLRRGEVRLPIGPNAAERQYLTSWPRRTARTAGATTPATTPTWRSARARRRCRPCSLRSRTRRS